jgi:hypothetical protein
MDESRERDSFMTISNKSLKSIQNATSPFLMNYLILRSNFTFRDKVSVFSLKYETTNLTSNYLIKTMDVNKGLRL